MTDKPTRRGFLKALGVVTGAVVLAPVIIATTEKPVATEKKPKTERHKYDSGISDWGDYPVDPPSRRIAMPIHLSSLEVFHAEMKWPNDAHLYEDITDTWFQK